MTAAPVRYVFKDFVGSSHWVALNVVRALRPPLRICDVGCGEGFLSRACKAMGHTVVGIDSCDPVASPSPWDRFHKLDLQHSPQDALGPDEPFDLILMLDVLEHLPEPGQVVRGFLPFLKPGGRLLLSVPNVAHAAIRAQLLWGRFQYADRGILDKGHLRFFTLKTFLSFLHETGLVPEQVWGTAVPLPLVWPRLFRSGRLEWINHLSFLLSHAWKTLFAYQLIATARVENPTSP